MRSPGFTGATTIQLITTSADIPGPDAASRRRRTRLATVTDTPIAPHHGRHAATLRGWLLALLRFAVTLDDGDRMTALAVAAELDRPGAAGHDAAFRFFTRASIRLCAAIAEPAHAASAAVLQEHLARIAHPKLQRAFAAALDIKPEKKRRADKCPAKPVDLWKGLRR